MRKNWTKNQDQVLTKIVGEVGLNDWTAVANRLKQRHDQIQRTGKQCRERWYNHLDPAVNKQAWSYEEELMLFELHRELGNRWKEISLQLKGRTDNNIKNHFYSTLRRSLRRLNKVIGQKNSTLQMREIKPSVLTIILNFIYDHQEQTPESNKVFLKELKDLPKLIFQFAQFKPVKGNMQNSIKEANRNKIQTIFRLIQTFKESYYNEKHEKKRVHFDQSSLQQSVSPATHQIITTEFKAHQKNVNVLINNQKEEDSSINHHTNAKLSSSQKQRSVGRQRLMFEGDSHLNLGEVQDPSPLTYIQENNPYPELIVIGRRWSPRVQASHHEEVDIYEILQMQYD